MILNFSDLYKVAWEMLSLNGYISFCLCKVYQITVLPNLIDSYHIPMQLIYSRFGDVWNNKTP